MQVVSFDIWSFILSFLVFFQTCTGVPATFPTDGSGTQNLVIPQEQKSSDDSDVKNKLTLILLKSGRVFAYRGSDVNDGTIYRKAEIRSVILAAKRKFSGDFVVLIKPSAEADYKTTVDVLDEMTVNKIDRYSVEDLSPAERQKLNLKNADDRRLIDRKKAD